MKNFMVLLIAVSLVAGAARAEECETEEADVDTGETPGGRYYVTNDCTPVVDGCLFSVWIYQESNGQDGLQRPDDFCTDHDSCCSTESDTILF